jgi:multidrug efflux pump
MNISRFFVDKPIFAAVLSIVIFVAGLISIFKLPISEYPDVVPPSVVVRAQYPGANPKIIAETVAAPLEEQINGVENMLYMSSQNTSDGALALTVTFKIGTNVEQAETQVQNRVQRAATPAGRSAPDRCDDREVVAQPDHGGPPEFAERPLRRPVSA